MAAAVVAALLLVAACDGQSTPTPAGSGPGASAGGSQPVGSEAPSGAASAPPSTAAGSPKPSTGPAVALQPNVAARITVTSLNVRDAPSTTAKKLGSFAKGDVVILLGYGGIKANGYTWYEAGRLKGLHGPLPPLPADPQQGNWSDLFGWIAVAQGSTPWVATLPARCPASTPDLATLSAMLLGEQLACFSATPLVLEGTWGCGGCGGSYPGEFTPEWLATPLSGFLSVNWTVRVGPLQLFFPPEVTRPAEGKILRVRAHLNDPRSSTCTVSTVTTPDSFTATPVPISATDAGTYCRQHLVVDSYEILGVDPSFPPT
ncbi:MAG: SH3 domain-containing protein [Chloroflexi bacterium]|nr:SH3 domain-containing protein [Chloroflexota bacterium]